MIRVLRAAAVIVALMLISLAGSLGSARAQDACGGCGEGMVCVNCGQGAQCAERPAVCCAGATCGGGMVCTQTARGPECGVPRVVRCGPYTCGEGMICVQTADGPQCGAPGPGRDGGLIGRPPGRRAAGVLGSVWSESELGWTGTWTRRPGTNVFDAVWTHPTGRREAATLTITIIGASVTIVRSQPPRGSCSYNGSLAADGRTVQGQYGCDCAHGPFPFSATIR